MRYEFIPLPFMKFIMMDYFNNAGSELKLFKNALKRGQPSGKAAHYPHVASDES